MIGVTLARAAGAALTFDGVGDASAAGACGGAACRMAAFGCALAGALAAG
jgi:hypothetical protein